MPIIKWALLLIMSENFKKKKKMLLTLYEKKILDQSLRISDLQDHI